MLLAELTAFLEAVRDPFPVVVIDLHGNSVQEWQEYWPAFRRAVAPGGRVLINNATLASIPEWRTESGVAWLLENLPPGWSHEVHAEPLPGLAVLVAPADSPALPLRPMTTALRAGLRRLRAAGVGLLAAKGGTTPAPPRETMPPVHGPIGPPTDSEADRWAAREMQQAALRSLPFLLNEIHLGPEAMHVSGYAGSADGVTAGMAVFVNGVRFNRVTYPIHHPDVAGRFAQAEGLGALISAELTQQLESLRAARFWRFDLSASGRHHPHQWRQAMHLMNPTAERFPLPPADSIRRVTGDPDETRFVLGGAVVFKNLENWLDEHGLGWGAFPRILDWGCGVGRLTRYLISETGAAVTGIDVDPGAMAWCREHLPGGRFLAVGLHPPTVLADSSFDLVVAVSVLTHLSEDQQHAWLSEMRRITRPGGLLFLSVRGPTQCAYMDLPGAIYRRIDAEGFIDMARDPTLDDVIDDKDYYRSVFHSRHYISTVWSRWFEIVAIEDGIAALQDFVVLRRV